MLQSLVSAYKGSSVWPGLKVKLPRMQHKEASVPLDTNAHKDLLLQSNALVGLINLILARGSASYALKDITASRRRLVAVR